MAVIAVAEVLRLSEGFVGNATGWLAVTDGVGRSSWAINLRGEPTGQPRRSGRS